MKFFKVILIIFILLPKTVNAQDTTYLKLILQTLASDKMRGRPVGTKEIDSAALYIAKQCKQIKLKPFCKKSYFQTFYLSDTIKNYGNLKCWNIIGTLDAKVDSTIIIGAHYDHIDTCSTLSKEIIKSKKCLIHNGADDNASGVALVLAIANTLVKTKQKYNYVFVFYTAHEIGLFGSTFFANSCFYTNLKVKALLNFDMVGRLNQDAKILKIGGITGNKKLESFINNTNSDSLHFLLNNEQLESSDATIFYKNKINSYSFTTGIHNDYHRNTDDTDKINYRGMKVIYYFIINFLNSI